MAPRSVCLAVLLAAAAAAEKKSSSSPEPNDTPSTQQHHPESTREPEHKHHHQLPVAHHEPHNHPTSEPNHSESMNHRHSRHVAKKRNTKGTKSGIELRGKFIYVDDEPFLMRGVAYSPVPLGDDPLYGFPYGDYFTNEYSAFWVRDLPLLSSMGANAIRTYSWNTTRDHTNFLDMVHANGIKVTITYFLGSTLQTPVNSKEDLTRVVQDFAHQVAKYKDHPAVLGWSFGNEINGNWNGFTMAMNLIFDCGWNPGLFPKGCQNFDMQNKTHFCYNATNCVYENLFKWIDQAAELGHKALGDQNYRLIFATYADVDNLVTHLELAEPYTPNIDMWAAQLYRGKDFGTGDTNFLLQVDRFSDKPLAITEYGVDAYSDSCGVCTEKHCPTPCYNSPTNETKGFGEDETTHAEWVSHLTKLLKDNHDSGHGVVGGFVMAWIDEAWKTTTHWPTNICADNTKKSHNGGWKFHYPHKKFDPKTCDFKAHVSCPNLNIWKPSLCGQYMPAFPDHYLNEGYFGINRVSGIDGTNVNQLDPRLVYLVLQKLWLPTIDPIIEWHLAAMVTLMTTLAVTIMTTIWACQKHLITKATNSAEQTIF